MHTTTIKSDQEMVTIPLKKYLSMQETIEVLQDRHLMRDIQRARKELREGKTISWDDLKKELGLDEN